MKKIELVYSSNLIAILSKYENEELIIINSDNYKVANCLYGLFGIDNELIEYCIKKVLIDCSSYILEEEIELYRKSDLYKENKEYNEVE